MRRVLIVSPRFPPVNAPDHHRVRTSLPYFTQFGWKPTVLSVTPETSDSVWDPLLLGSIPSDVEIHRVAGWKEEKTRRFGFGHLDHRCLAPIFRAGTELLSTSRYDVVYFSTTVFATFVLARFWKRRFRSKIVFDFQDPWYHAGNHVYNSSNAPGGWFKYRLSQVLSRHEEKFALKAADHIISVSEGYVMNLSSRYPWLTKDKFTVIPFGAAPQDYETVRRRGVRQTIFPANDGFIHWTYVGRGGPDMEPVLATFFRALASLKRSVPDFTARLRVHFVGTNYAPPDRTYKVIEPIAAQCGVAELVQEHSARIPYFHGLAAMADSDAVLLIGSIAADYTPSKFFNCVLAKKPVLALLNTESLVSRMISQYPNVRLAGFRDDPSAPAFQTEVESCLRWLAQAKSSLARYRFCASTLLRREIHPPSM